MLTGTVLSISPGPPLVLAIAAAGGAAVRFTLDHTVPSHEMEVLARELLGQTVDFRQDEREALVWFYRPASEDGEVEFVYRACLNTELRRMGTAPAPDAAGR